jgi:hypothetical protein
MGNPGAVVSMLPTLSPLLFYLQEQMQVASFHLSINIPWRAVCYLSTWINRELEKSQSTTAASVTMSGIQASFFTSRTLRGLDSFCYRPNLLSRQGHCEAF